MTKPMSAPAERTSSLLLERPGGRNSVLPDDGSAVGRWEPADGRPTVERLPGSSSDGDKVLISPGMALVATVAILEGYTWLGAIPSSDSRLSAVVFGRGGALVFAALAAVAVPAFTRADAEGRRPLSQRLVLLATAALIASSVVLLMSTATPTRYATGISDLVLASALAGMLVAGERKRRTQRQGGLPPARGDSTERTFQWSR
jgi:hypothetical protein